jgi:hypothetical protein
MAIVGVLLLTASATYAVLKWRILVPRLSNALGEAGKLGVPFAFANVGDMLNIVALPYISAVLGAVAAIWAILVDISFEGNPGVLLQSSHAALFCAVATFAFPHRVQWSISTTLISSSVAAHYVGKTSHATLAGWTTLFILNLTSCITNIFHDNHK